MCTPLYNNILNRSISGNTPWQRQKTVFVSLADIPSIIKRVIPLQEISECDVKFSVKSKAHRFYQTMLKLCPDANVFQYNQMCEVAGVRPWTKERQQPKRNTQKKYSNTTTPNAILAS